MKTMNIIRLLISLSLPLLIGAVSGFFTSNAIPVWYASLTSPAISPPNWIFGPVWTVLYILMGVSFYLIWCQPASKAKSWALAVYFIQLLLNFAWSFFFFYFKHIGLALMDIVILWLCIPVMISLFYRIKPAAAYINIPYFLWVSFATILNAAFFKLN
ncbi:MAG: TspO/MBR family protein [Bacteroidota bacterium]|jgi:translocator protein